MMQVSITGDPPFFETFEQLSIDEYPIHVLGKSISRDEGIEALKKYIHSRLWFTYRKNFSPIGGTGPTSDQGWGCMLRCAQMLLGETLLRRHIGRHFEWDIDEANEIYEKILQLFFDEKDALYSIHQIAQMGVCEGKAVSEWFGPNTAAQVIKKLTIFDEWSNIAVHVALDNILVKEDAITMATTYPSNKDVQTIIDAGVVNSLPKTIDGKPNDWRPLLLIIPLRLGLTTINPCYLQSIKDFFQIPQCIGIIGGRPNYALYFIGISGTKLIYLDPHYCRPKTYSQSWSFKKNDSESVDKAKTIDDTTFNSLEFIEPMPSSTSDMYTKMDDSTYHCKMLLWMEYESIDPSLALSFFCETRKDFDEVCDHMKKSPSSNTQMFEILEKRPSYWPPFEPYVGAKVKIEENDFCEMQTRDSDEEFEVLG